MTNDALVHRIAGRLPGARRESRALRLKLVAACAAICLAWGMSIAASGAGAAACAKVASPLGSDAYPGTVAEPYATVEHLANSLSPGETGCLRAGVLQGDVKVTKGGVAGSPTTITSYPGERATVVGRFRVADTANHVTVTGLDLDGRNEENLPSPTINGDQVTFSANDVTNHHTTICFIVGSDTYGRARDAVIERNRIHDCGQLPATNHHHGIYVEASDRARITDNWIYDNADRGVQLFPDAQSTYIARNVIDGNGQGIIFSRESANNLAEHNVISNPVLRYNIEEWELTGGGNMARRNCVWSTRHQGNAGIQPGLDVPTIENKVTEPGYVNRGDKDFRLRADSPCVNFAAGLQPAAKKPRAKRGKRAVRLRSNTASVWPGGHVRLRARVVSKRARASAAKRAVLKVRRGGRWRKAGTMRLRGGRCYLYRPRLGRPRGGKRRFGGVRLKRGAGVLRLRAYVKGAGRSNIVRIRVGR
ncbi:MAG: right-handed parallel beta-helix repeat-containing protein [Solirubrobacterales bacterium]